MKLSRLEERRAAAKRLAHHLTEFPAVAAVLVFGSVASGCVDEASDIDMLVVCEPEIPSPTLRREWLGENWTGVAGDPMFPVIDEGRSTEGIPVTLHYQKTSWIEHVLSEVLTRGAITTAELPFRPYTLAGLLARAWVLEDRRGTVAGWRAQTANFPPVLEKNLLEHFTPLLREHTAELVTNAKRQLGPRNVIFSLNWAVDALADILYALNGVYDPADKRAERTVWPHFRVAPQNFSARLAEILAGPFDDRTAVQKAEQFEALAAEVLVLIDSRRELAVKFP